jgi:hypothetical protein
MRKIGIFETRNKIVSYKRRDSAILIGQTIQSVLHSKSLHHKRKVKSKPSSNLNMVKEGSFLACAGIFGCCTFLTGWIRRMGRPVEVSTDYMQDRVPRQEQENARYMGTPGLNRRGMVPLRALRSFESPPKRASLRGGVASSMF